VGDQDGRHPGAAARAGSKPKREQAQSRRRDGDEPEETSIPIDLDDQDAGSPEGADPSPAATVVGAALDDALSRPMSLVELDQYATPAAIPTPGWTPDRSIM